MGFKNNVRTNTHWISQILLKKVRQLLRSLFYRNLKRLKQHRGAFTIFSIVVASAVMY